MLPPDHDGVVITGKRKKGKSTLTMQLLAGEKRVIVYDAKGELREPRKIDAGVYPSDMPRVGVYRAYIPTDNAPAEELEWSAYLATELGRCVFVVDELPDALEDGNPGKWFSWVTRMGRKRGVRFIYTFQRPQEVPRMCTAQAADWYLFQTNEANELQYIKASVSSEAASIVKHLKRGQALHVKDGTPVGIMETEKP